MISEKILSGINGKINIPGDKSISHRAIIIPSISNGICEIKNLLKSDDVIHTLNAFKLMGVKIEESNNQVIVYGNGLNSLKKPYKEIYLGNSGTSARLLVGLLASQKFNTILTGDKSLSSRPMKRITDPLEKAMGASIKTTKGSLPLKILSTDLINNENGINIKIPSAQIKSGIILAALNTKGITKIIEHNVTRDHTEIMLESFGAGIETKNINQIKEIKITGKKELLSKNIEVPSDLSSSAFLIVAALINRNSKIILKNININPTRDGILRALQLMGAKITITNKKKLNNEPVADIEALSSNLKGCELDKESAKLMIDEYPILAVAASFAKSPSIFRGLSELKVKESNRLELIRLNLNNCGVYAKIIGDDLYIDPSKSSGIKTKLIRTDFDHRIAMSFAIMGTKIGGLNINDPESINTSFPNFVQIFNNAGGNIIEK
tara:strand:+ start:734 stop:2047 length:1314 start_codon:yes stop_codon:yes gene_type:complete